MTPNSWGILSFIQNRTSVDNGLRRTVLLKCKFLQINYKTKAFGANWIGNYSKYTYKQIVILLYFVISVIV